MSKAIIVFIFFSSCLFYSCKESKKEMVKPELIRVSDTIEYLRLSYKDILKYKCIYSKSEMEYMNKNFYFAMDLLNKVALVKIKDHKNRTVLPLVSTNFIDEEKKIYFFQNDSIGLEVNLKPGISKIQSAEKYSANVKVLIGRDTSKYNMIGYCRD